MIFTPDLISPMKNSDSPTRNICKFCSKELIPDNLDDEEEHCKFLVKCVNEDLHVYHLSCFKRWVTFEIHSCPICQKYLKKYYEAYKCHMAGLFLKKVMDNGKLEKYIPYLDFINSIDEDTLRSLLCDKGNSEKVNLLKSLREILFNFGFSEKSNVVIIIDRAIQELINNYNTEEIMELLLTKPYFCLPNETLKLILRKNFYKNLKKDQIIEIGLKLMASTSIPFIIDTRENNHLLNSYIYYNKDLLKSTEIKDLIYTLIDYGKFEALIKLCQYARISGITLTTEEAAEIVAKCISIYDFSFIHCISLLNEFKFDTVFTAEQKSYINHCIQQNSSYRESVKEEWNNILGPPKDTVLDKENHVNAKKLLAYIDNFSKDHVNILKFYNAIRKQPLFEWALAELCEKILQDYNLFIFYNFIPESYFMESVDFDEIYKLTTMRSINRLYVMIELVLNRRYFDIFKFMNLLDIFIITKRFDAIQKLLLFIKPAITKEMKNYQFLYSIYQKLRNSNANVEIRILSKYFTKISKHNEFIEENMKKCLKIYHLYGPFTMLSYYKGPKVPESLKAYYNNIGLFLDACFKAKLPDFLIYQILKEEFEDPKLAKYLNISIYNEIKKILNGRKEYMNLLFESLSTNLSLTELNHTIGSDFLKSELKL